MQDRDIDKALVGFTHAVQLDPDNGEAWNNIACLYVLAFGFFFFCLLFPRNMILQFVPLALLISSFCLEEFLLSCLTLHKILVTAKDSFLKSLCGCVCVCMCVHM